MRRAGVLSLLGGAVGGAAVGAVVMLFLVSACAPSGGSGGAGGGDGTPDDSGFENDNGAGIENDNQTVAENDNGSAPPDEAAPVRNARLAAVNDWAYVLQGDPVLDLDAIAESAFDLVVIDYSEDGGEEGEFSREDLENLRRGPGGERIVLAYMSIGEAEAYRFYFDGAWVRPDPEADPDGPFELTDQAPGFLAPPNPAWPGNFKVRYWDPQWQQIIVSNPEGSPYIGDADSYLERIVEAGFDGVYLDIIDAYEYFGPEEINSGGLEERRDAAELMIDLVIAIKEHAEAYGGREFLVFPQNGSGIIGEEAFPADAVPEGETPASYAARMGERYFAAIDGIGAEDTFYFGDADEDNPYAPQTEVIDLLERYRSAGLAVLAVDYLTDEGSVDDFYARARDRGWVPYSTIRDLSVLTVNGTELPD